MKAKLLLFAAPLAFLGAVPAHAAVPVNLGGCNVNSTDPNAVQCSGYYTGNVLNNQADSLQAQVNGLSAIGYTFDSSTFNSLLKVINGTGGVTGSNIFFGTPLSGTTYIGIHWGNVPDFSTNNVTAFYKLNFAPGTTSFSLDNPSGFSDAVLYSTVPGVPEASTWAMMLVGLGGIGWALRRKRQEASTTARISFA